MNERVKQEPVKIDVWRRDDGRIGIRIRQTRGVGPEFKAHERFEHELELALDHPNAYRLGDGISTALLGFKPAAENIDGRLERVCDITGKEVKPAHRENALAPGVTVDVIGRKDYPR